MKTIRLNIKMCGTHSITGCIADKVLMNSETPDKIIIDIETVMQATDVQKEFEKAKLAFSTHPFVIEIGNVGRDFYKEHKARDPNGTACFS